jgi:hypothetical protein
MDAKERLVDVTFLDRAGRMRRRYTVLSSGQRGFLPYDKVRRWFLPFVELAVPSHPAWTRAEWQAATSAAAWDYLRTTTVEDYKMLRVERALDGEAA